MYLRKLIFLSLIVALSFAFHRAVFAAVSPLDLNGNGIQDANEAEVVLSSNASLPAGEYVFNNLIITNNATLSLLGDPLSPNTFKGVKIIVTNLTVNFGSSISADYKGYGLNQGPGASPLSSIGASYGGTSYGGSMTSIYGSATAPTDLGSGGNSYGGGAIYIVVSNTFTNNGVISANGNISSSGGSIYVTVNNMAGSGALRANGGNLYALGYFKSPGGGGRIAVYYHISSFNGVIEAKGGCGSYDGYSPSCGQNGTVGIFDESINNLYVNSSWQFRANDNPLIFNNIYISNGAKVASESGANITANNIFVDDFSIFTLSGNETINTENLSVTGNSTITVIPEHALFLKIPNITIDSGSMISADAKGYLIGPGSPEIYSEAGASYGGRGGGVTAKPVYGSAEAPVDFGSGTGWHRGGGAIRLIVDNNFKNDGIVSASATYQHVSGGSIYVNADKITGSGTFKAGGGNSSWPYGYIGGGGGRVAIYFQESSFTGATTALAGVYCMYGCLPAAQNGTVIMESIVLPCAINCFSNVLFLPGTMGSRLYEAGLNCGPDIIGPECGDQELWVSASDSQQEKLSLNNQGKSINNLFTKNDTQKLDTDSGETGLVDEISVFNIYKSFITDLKNWKEDGTIADYAFIPYDWRLSLEDVVTNGATNGDNNLSYTNSQGFSESFILKKLADLQENSKSGKVTIIAHSNGGLVAKALIQKLKDTNNPLYNKIDKIIFIATPQVGTPDAIATLLHGASLGHGLVMDADRSRQLSENMSSIYNFLPSADYFSMAQIPFVADKLITFENKPFFNSQISKYGLNISDEINLKNYILGTDGRTKPSFNDTVHPNIGNSSLYTQAEAVHQILDNWQPSPNTKVIQVAGWGEETLAGLDYKSYVDFWGSEYLSYKLNMVIDGDGTVVAPSALWMSASPNIERWWVDLKNYNTLTTRKRVHRDILETSNLLDFLKSQITSSGFSDPNNIVVNNTSTLVSEDTRLHYTLHSPLTLGITDAQGRYTGQDPVTKQIREKIPGVDYEKIGDVQFLSAPADISYTVKMQGYTEGSFSLDVDKQRGNEITASISFQGIPSSTSTLATMEIVPNLEIANAELKIDQNGDGTIDKTLNATPDGITIYDITPPELQVTFDINNKNVVFSGQDDHDPNPTVTTADASITLTDAQGNTTIIPLIKYKEKPTKLKFSYNKIIRNGIATIVPNTNIIYDWQEKKGVLSDLDTKVIIKGVEKYVFNYKKENNVTIIKKKTSSGIVVTTRPGFVVVTVNTEGDGLRVDY